MGLTVLIVSHDSYEGIMPFIIIVLLVPFVHAIVVTLGSTTTGLGPPLKYLVL